MFSLSHPGWRRSFLLGFFLFVLFAIYSFVREGFFDVYIFNRVSANVGMLLIGYSIAVVSVTHYFNRGENDIPFRKELGIVGFLFIINHGVVTLLLPRFPLEAFFLPQNIVAFLLAVVSFLVLTMMTVISFGPIKRILGIVWWKRLLGLGLLAYIFGLLHAIIKSSPSWGEWDLAVTVLPPLSFVVSVLAVILLLVCLAFGLKK